jgi:outer membrane protein
LRRATLTAACVLVLALLLPAAAAAADTIAYIDSERIRSEYEGARDIQSQLEASVADWRARAREMESEIDTMISEYQSQKLLLSEQALREKETAIQQKQGELDKFLNDVWGVGGLAVQRESELWQPVIERINTILRQIGPEGDYAMIFDAATTGIVYAAPGIDLTQEVIDQLNTGGE